jgi:Helix-turn-helix.
VEIYLIGKTIREFRLRKGFSQEKVSDGICAVSTLSRIECGLHIPNRKLAEALFSKMGMTPPLHTVLMKESDIIRWNLEYEINNSIANRNYEIKNLLRQYRQCRQGMDIFEKQFHIFFCTVYDSTHGTPPEKTLPFYLKALNYTIPSFTPDTGTECLSPLLLTKIERMIINNIAITLYNLKKYKKS